MKKLMTLFILTVASIAISEELGRIKLSSGWTFSNYQIVVSNFIDPENPCVTCYISQVQDKSILSISDPSNMSIACRQTGKVNYDSLSGNPIIKTATNYNVYSESKSALFKQLKVARFYDAKNKVLTYTAYTTKMFDGSFKNSTSVVPIR